MIKQLKHNLFLQFTILSFLVLAAVAGFIAYILSATIQQQAIQAALDDTIAHTRSRVTSVLTPADLMNPMIGERYARFDDYLQTNVIHGRTVRVKLWSPDKTVIYSTEQNLIGLTFPDNDELEEALQGKVAAELPSQEKQRSEKQENPRPLIEVYAPILFPNNDKPAGALEIYDEYGPVLSLINDMRFRVVQVVGAGFIMLYILLVGIVWNGWKTIIRQRRGRKDAENLFKAMLDSSPIGIYVVADGKFRLVNPQFEKVTGYRADELLGKESLSIVLPEDLKVVRENAKRMLKGQSFNPYEYRSLNKNGEIRWIMETIASINYKGKRAALGNYMDITGLKLTRKALEDSREKLQHAQKMEAIGRLAGGVAHDFNNLLTVITVCGDTLLEKVGENNSVRRDVEDIRSASDRAAALTKQLLILSRKHIQHSEVLDLNYVTGEITKMLQRIIGENCQLEVVLENGLKSIYADRGFIEQALMNLVVNARDALPDGGKITIRTERVILAEKDVAFMTNSRAGEFIRLSVTDTGIGMSEEIKQHLFEPFFTTKERGKGTGLGLSTVYGIVKQLGGWINVYSEVGRGSRFSVYLPVHHSAAKDLALSGKKEVKKDYCGHGERILLVEDEAQILSLSGRLLTESGYVVFSAKSVNDAMSVFLGEGGNFHLVFSDVVLPDGSGIELVRLLEKLNPNIRILISSGYADETSQFSLIKERGYPYLQKPYKVDTLLQNIRETLSSGKPGVFV